MKIWLKKFLISKMNAGLCNFADCFEFGKRRRQLTQYADDHLNWDCLCCDHQDEVDEYWIDMWSDYYSRVL